MPLVLLGILCPNIQPIYGHLEFLGLSLNKKKKNTKSDKVVIVKE